MRVQGFTLRVIFENCLKIVRLLKNTAENITGALVCTVVQIKK